MMCTHLSYITILLSHQIEYESKADGHQKLVVHTDQVLGSIVGGKVVKATLDKHPCAAKFFDWSHYNHSHVEQECKFWQDLYISSEYCQFLGRVLDPRTNTPIILMELMEQSLRQLLERSSTDIPYHVQVNISHDIALAFDHLHRNRILHRNLSDYNILLNAHYQAKVTGFRKSISLDSNPTLPLPMMPLQGYLLLLPPEAFLEDCYSDKSD